VSPMVRYEPQWVSTAQVTHGRIMLMTPSTIEWSSRTCGSANGTNAVTTSTSASILGGYNAPEVDVGVDRRRVIAAYSRG
jgi:hypothetical protein